MTLPSVYPQTLKRCCVCQQSKSLDHFYKRTGGSSRSKDGYRNDCIACCKVRRAGYYHSDPEAAKQAAQEWTRNNPDRVNARNTAYYADHKDQIREWQRENRDAVLVTKRRRHRRFRAAQGSYTKEQFHLRCQVHDWRCYYCGAPVTHETVQVDHRIPLARGGSNWPANLVPCCVTCNNRKHTRTEQEYKLIISR